MLKNLMAVGAIALVAMVNGPALADDDDDDDDFVRTAIEALDQRVTDLESAPDLDTNAGTICAPGTILTGEGTCVPLPVDTDTSAATLCAPGTILTGEGTCVALPVDTDTNAATLCAGGEVLTGNGTCASLPTGSNGDLGPGANVVGQDLTFDALAGEDLRGLQAMGASGFSDLTDTDLSFADLRGADLRLANLCGTDFSYADVTDAQFPTDATLNPDLCPGPLVIVNSFTICADGERGSPSRPFACLGVALSPVTGTISWDGTAFSMNGSLLRTDGISEPLPDCPLGEATGFSVTEPQITVPGTAANPRVVNINSATQGRTVGLAAPCTGSVCARSATVRFPRSFSAGATAVRVLTNAPEVDHSFEFTFTRECG